MWNKNTFYMSKRLSDGMESWIWNIGCRFKSRMTFLENFAISSNIALAVAMSKCAKFSLFCKNCSALKTSFKIKSMSLSGAF